EEPAAPARVIKTFTKEAAVDRPELKAALVDGDFYAADTLDVLASLKSKDELIGDILALLAAPIKNVVGAIQAPGRNLAGAIQTIAEKE
ncbi:MAG: 50S ribosomal protein L10, partial [Rhodothermales bacterium]